MFTELLKLINDAIKDKNETLEYYKKQYNNVLAEKIELKKENEKLETALMDLQNEVAGNEGN